MKFLQLFSASHIISAAAFKQKLQIWVFIKNGFPTSFFCAQSTFYKFTKLSVFSSKELLLVIQALKLKTEQVLKGTIKSGWK